MTIPESLTQRMQTPHNQRANFRSDLRMQTTTEDSSTHPKQACAEYDATFAEASEKKRAFLFLGRSVAELTQPGRGLSPAIEAMTRR
jgi:hypothetical protein